MDNRLISDSSEIYKYIARLLLKLEPILLAITLFAFWHHSPPIRDNWVWLIVFFPIMCGIRWFAYGRLFTRTPFILWMFLFLILTAFNFEFAPYHRANYWVLVCRPIAGIWLVIYFTEVSRLYSPRPIIISTVLLGLLISILALTATQWTVKSDLFESIIAFIPRPDYRSLLPDMLLNFNPNEIAGAISWVLPTAVVFTFNRNLSNWIRVIAGTAALFLLSSLMFGQSRFAIGGVVVGFAFIIIALSRSKQVLLAAGLSLSALVVLEASILFNVFPTAESTSSTPSLSRRDEQTSSTRLLIWERGIRMTLDYPLTGVGMSTYRQAVRTETYVIPYFEQQNLGPPHAHNQWIQVAADLGIPGLAIYIIWYGLAFSILWHQWKSKDDSTQYYVAAVAGGLIAYIGYSIGDTITLWDRFHFLLWWYLGMAAALHCHQPIENDALDNPNKK